MTVSPLARPWRTARAAAALLALGAAGLTAAATPATGGSHDVAAPAAAAATVSAVQPCRTTAGSAERVRAGSDDESDPNDLTVTQSRQMDARLQTRLQQRRPSLEKATSASRRIDVYVHVIEKDDGKGGVSTKRVKKQISVLNRAYAGKTSAYSTSTGFTFRLKKIDRTKKTSWYHWSRPDVSSSDDVHAKTKLHKGRADDLNLYVTSLRDGLLGYATFPDQVLSKPKLDGVVVLNASLPGGSARHYSSGDTATHEVGHWLGLLHTFENDCAAPGDGVADTPAQDFDASDFSVCVDADTCAADPGHDPVHNFMNYTDDACMNRFTPGQAARMLKYWNAYRQPGSPV